MVVMLSFIVVVSCLSSCTAAAVLDVEDSVVSTGEESTGILIVVIRESVGGVGVSSCIKLGPRSGS